FTSQVLEAGEGVGGTWFWNRYPGARVDIESTDYSYSFSPELEQEWEWSERFPTQPELLRYINHVADRFQLRDGIQFNTRVESAHFDEATGRWDVRTDTGDRFSAQFCVMATGCLSDAKVPQFPGVDSFEGATYHTGRWPHEGVDFTGLRVGIIGTGSSGIQSIPLIAAQAEHLYVFQRTPNFSIPARNGQLDPDYLAEVKANYRERRAIAKLSVGGTNAVRPEKKVQEDPDEVRNAIYEERWQAGGLGAITGAYNNTIVDREANEIAAEFVRGKIRETVKDPAVAELLCPRDYPIGTKRICLDTNYYETFNRENVTLVDVKRAPIVEVLPHGLRTDDKGYELDAIVYATGFDAMTGALTGIDIQGRGGEKLAEKWADGPRTYLGIASVGFPNLFMITGPGSPSVLSNMITSIEQHVDWVADYVTYLRDHNLTHFEPLPEAEDKWVEHVNEVAHRTLYPTAASWYMGANIPGKTRVFMPYVGGVGTYRLLCDDIAAKDYEGFVLSGAS
ncbi:MAG: NAD(P)/FAD-dependent oxidoreductase, partial [Jatrophihabitantaceae bacterium]|nr:NAD(P)/FAD-dependent oxidoreductase [Jatrophihabitantaceae bacterium]